MPDWKSPTELLKDSDVFMKCMHALLGLYIYEWFISLGFDWDFISGKKRFRWPMIFYFSGRYLLLFGIIGIAIALDSTVKINCQALYLFNQLAGNAAVGMASINLSIRTMAVWSQNKYIIGLLVLVILGHWSLILQGVLLSATWIDDVGCVITSTNNRVLAATFIYSMSFDLLVLMLSTYRLLNADLMDGFGTNRIAKIIFEDGLIFFIIAFLANLLATVFLLLDLNQIMSVVFNVPAAVASTIVASRAVRHLANFQNASAGICAATSHSGNVNFRNEQTAGRGITTIGVFQEPRKHGVHVQVITCSLLPPLSSLMFVVDTKMETFAYREDIQDHQEVVPTREGVSDIGINLKMKGHPP
ncbi:hypothetical protein Hypma_002269 [Hypsizygus marmoreus]|uniref:Transmembrane protein n=1 Tax=Hypsizygus marmoreus TaxID=39966 RepID=A0A369K358_HYPMA|nr:hypothetical protein Hypma_002269 [Hypsizygus marmoreus]